MKKSLKLPLFLASVVIICTLVVSFIYELTIPFIRDNALKEELVSLNKLYEDETIKFTELNESFKSGTNLEKIFKATKGNDNEPYSYVYKINGKGYGGGAVIVLIAINYTNLTYDGYVVVDISSQTPGIGDIIATEEFTDSFLHKKIEEANPSLTTGATTGNITIKAVVTGMEAATADFLLNRKG